MLIWTAKFSKKMAVFAVILMGLVMALLILLMGREAPQEAPAQPQLLTNEERVTYLESLGWQVESEPVETLQLLLPKKLEEPYLSYNDLQLTQGYDLSPCCGKRLSRYTYAVTNYPDRPSGVQANLYLCEDLPVAGDIFCPDADGFQDTLVYPEETT
ncbi:DUF4830 domain-containing protein [Oscillibacter sp.]|uniref:DUF4830 domain-containing protein n=1 Tax=Oscillibacter sp. TaxID=1945593 RepID=UPI002601668E|nr:DUF4830 domain-containing protein [Oscillibacter sp.]MDD3347283.1 DUF4830 domain-containing protein [Oscillibacter sp.]